MKVSLKFPYELKHIPKSFGLRWNKSQKTWDGILSVDAALEMENKYSNNGVNIQSFLNQFSYRRNLVTQLNSAQPMKHQEDAVSAIKGINRYGLFHDMGIGKTVSVLLAAQDLWQEKEITHLFVLAPLAVLMEWENQIQRFTTIPVTVQRIAHRKASKREIAFRLFLMPKDNLSIGLLNYEALRTIPEDILNDIPETLMIVADESTRIKNRNAKATKIATKISDKKAKYAVILTGTPISNCVSELFSQIRFLSKSYLGGSYWRFIDRYARMGGFEGRQIIGPKNEETLHKVISYFTSTIKKEEVLDLPEKIYTTRTVTLTGTQLAAYEDAQDDFLFAVDAIEKTDPNEKEFYVLIKNALARMAYCQRIAAGHVREEDSEKIVRFKDNQKMKTLVDLIDDIGDQQFVIFCRFREDINMIEEALSETRNIVVFHGGLSSEESDRNLVRFQSGDADGFVSQVQKGGYGINLSMASIAIFYTNWFSYGTRDQAESRIHRKGQINKCQYIDIVAKDTVDEDILEAILRKKAVSDLILDKYKP